MVKKVGGIEFLGEKSTNAMPNWTRRPRKWQEVIDAVMSLEPGKAAIFRFPTREDAENARSSVRDAVNLALKKPVVRTRVIQEDENGETATVWFAMLEDADIKQSD